MNSLYLRHLMEFICFIFIIYSSTLTIRILKKRYLAHVQGDTLSPEAKSFMKQVVQEEILKMQVPSVSNSVGRVVLYFV